MEDLAISPWENSHSTNDINIFESRQKTALKVQRPLTLKNRYVHTESSNRSPPSVAKQYSLLELIQKKKLSSSTHQNFYHQQRIKRPSKLQLKLVAFPIQQNLKQRQTGIRFSEKFKAKSKFLNQSFEVVETILNSELKLLRVFKERTINKNNTANQNLLNNKIENQNLIRASESLDRLKTYMRDNYHNGNTKVRKVQRQKDEEFMLSVENKNKIEKLQQLSKKQSLTHLKLNIIQKLKLHSQDLPQLNITLDDSKMYQTNISESWKQQRNKSRKDKERQKKLSIQKLENINCFRDTTNIFTKLQKKNKVLFNKLEKYNLFGLKTLKNKSLIK